MKFKENTKLYYSDFSVLEKRVTNLAQQFDLNIQQDVCQQVIDDNWILTYSGKHFRPLDPCVNDICIEDIAHALSQICRYTGQILKFYSVGEHSYLLAERLLKDGYGPRKALEGLLHDGTEAYLSDIARPIKIQPQFQLYRQAEAKLEYILFKKFNLTVDEKPGIIKDYDSRILITEMNVLFKHLNFKLAGDGLKVKIHGWPPKKAEAKFLEMYNYLKDKIDATSN